MYRYCFEFVAIYGIVPQYIIYYKILVESAVKA